MRPVAFRLIHRFSPIAVLAFCSLIVSAPRSAHGQAEMVSAEERAAFHQDPQWLMLAPHLPDPHTGTPAQLELAADVLRARRFPEDALDYYGYALARGGSVSELLNKMGVIRLELHQTDVAHELFLRTVRANKKNATAWNNLGVTEYVRKQYGAAISDYRRAAKLDKKTAVYCMNLGMAYFESGDMESARIQFAQATVVDPHAFDTREGGGLTVHAVGTQNYAQLAFEMARVYAKKHDDANTILWLAKASEAGFDTRHEMYQDAALSLYAKDPRVVMLLRNAKQMRERSVASALPVSLGPAAPTEQRVD